MVIERQRLGLRSEEGEEGAGQVGPNDRVGRMTGGPARPLGLEGEMGRHENKNKRNKGNRTGLQGNLGQNGQWAEENMKKMFL
jgi:hypothetical protein